METPFLSLIIPAHNEANRLEEALQKVEGFIRQQDYSVEVILVENASSDATVEIARSCQLRAISTVASLLAFSTMITSTE